MFLLFPNCLAPNREAQAVPKELKVYALLDLFLPLAALEVQRFHGEVLSGFLAIASNAFRIAAKNFLSAGKKPEILCALRINT